MTNPATTRRDAPSLVSVNRIHKQDRLPPAAALTYQQPNAALSTRISSVSPKRPPVGCDPAFSPVAEPARANIFRRCLTSESLIRGSTASGAGDRPKSRWTSITTISNVEPHSSGILANRREPVFPFGLIAAHESGCGPLRWGNRPAFLWIAEEFWVLRFRLMVKRGPCVRPPASKEKRSIDHFAGLDVSVKETSVCIVYDAGKIVREAKIASEPEALLSVLKNLTYRFKRIGLEAGPLSQWLFSALAEAGLPVICVETRHMRAVLKAQINKTTKGMREVE